MKIKIISILSLVGGSLMSFSNPTPLPSNSFSNQTIFTPTPYNPSTVDYTILQNSIQRKNERENAAYKSIDTVIDLCKELLNKLPETEYDWFLAYIEPIVNSIDEQISLGNHQSAIQMANNAILKLNSDKQILYRIDSYND